jgi:hypothetical protein
MSDQNEGVRATAREWRIALMVVAGGFAIAIAVAIYFAFAQKPAPSSVAAVKPPLTAPQKAAQYNAKAALLFCAADILEARKMGLVPPYGRYAGGPNLTKRRGRYVCIAGTGVAKYSIAADLVCANFAAPRCVQLYSVVSDDGTVLYKRTKD